MSRVRVILVVAATMFLMEGCSMQKKIQGLSLDASAPRMSIAEDIVKANHKDWKPDTLTVLDDADGKHFIFTAVRDENGEMVATDRIGASIVTASFKNVAERHGKVDLRFQITVPESMIDNKWQVRLDPELILPSGRKRLERIVITGRKYREAQLRGYQLYERFLKSIVSDSASFIQVRDLELFISRNIPELYRLKRDSSYVCGRDYESVYGVGEQEAVRHYTDMLALRINELKKSRTESVFHRYVKSPIVTEGLRLDTVIVAENGMVSYEYIQTITAAPRMKKALILLSGGVYDGAQKLFDTVSPDTLTFYISTIGSLADQRQKFRTKIIRRRLSDNSVCWIEFKSGRSDLDRKLGNNEVEMSRIENNLRQLMEDELYDIDSIVVTASSSPEGNYEYNRKLSHRRSLSVCRFYSGFIKDYADSSCWAECPSIEFIPKSIPENWSMLESSVCADSEMQDYLEDFKTVLSEQQPDLRERRLSGKPYYRYLREMVYPKLRTVRFDFYLHRKGMVQDTLQTTEVDVEYMSGVKAITELEYENALSILRPYKDYNTAVAYCALDYNASAIDILEKLPPDERTEYLKAIIYSRMGQIQKAVSSYLKSCEIDPSFVFRGNLDPEISELIKKYNLNKNFE